MARKRESKNINLLYLILVEGYTEKIYFDALWEHNPKQGFTIKIKKAKHGNLATLIDEALRCHQEGVYHQIWCVYDCDVLLQQDTSNFKKVYQTAKNNNIKFAESMLSIEVWFLLHFKKPKQIYQSGEALINDLQKYIDKYRKDQKWLEKNLYSQLESHQKEAFKMANDFTMTDHYNPQTATSVHNLVNIFLEGNNHGS
jgi:hypothetical protein